MKLSAVESGLPTSRRVKGRVGWRLVGGLGWLALALGACIIEERKYSVQLDNCWEYCDRIEQSCGGSAKVYDTTEACLATCMLMESGTDVGDTTMNTLSCRLERLRGGIEGQQCAQVGPGGNGACGSNCRALCALRSQVCSGVSPGTTEQSDVNDVAKCENECQGLSELDAPGVDLSGDTVHCRLAYVARAAVSPEAAAVNCSYSQIRPVRGEDPATAPCSDPSGLDKNTECEKYCDLVTAACTGEYAVYTSNNQCLETCRQTMEPGEPGDETEDTIRCRRYHAYFALIQPDQHCLHASPTGDGHCGTENCTGYCRILQQACGEDFERQFGATSGTTDGGLAACAAACLPDPITGTPKISSWKRDEFALPPTGSRYQVDPPPTGPTLMCRAYHAVQALTASVQDRPMNCAAAFGGGVCR